MSSTNRGAKRNPYDNYATPGWVTRVLLDHITSPATAGKCSSLRQYRCPEIRLGIDLSNPTTRVLEPCAGEGAILKELLAHPNIQVQDITAVEIREEARPALCKIIPRRRVKTRDCTTLNYKGQQRFDLAITNPPFSRALDVTEWCLNNASAKVVIVLQRLNWLCSAGRREFMVRHRPDLLVLPQRPSFTGGKTDSTEYAWFIFHLRSASQYTLAPTQSLKERKCET